MKKSIITAIVTVLCVLVIEAVIGYGLISSGAYSISMLNHDTGFINRVLDRGMQRSVARHARGIQAPPLTDPGMLREGADHFNTMCVECHGAPGVKSEEIARGLWPDAPDLAKTVPSWTPAELFWITKNGIKFSAMPAWGPSHSDEKIWAMVAFMETLPRLSPAEYSQKTGSTGQGGDGGESKDEHK